MPVRGFIDWNMVERALRVGSKSKVETNCVGTAMPMSPGHTARSRFAPSTMMGMVSGFEEDERRAGLKVRVALLSQPVANTGEKKSSGGGMRETYLN